MNMANDAGYDLSDMTSSAEDLFYAQMTGGNSSGPFDGAGLPEHNIRERSKRKSCRRSSAEKDSTCSSISTLSFRDEDSLVSTSDMKNHVLKVVPVEAGDKIPDERAHTFDQYKIDSKMKNSNNNKIGKKKRHGSVKPSKKVDGMKSTPPSRKPMDGPDNNLLFEDFFEFGPLTHDDGANPAIDDSDWDEEFCPGSSKDRTSDKCSRSETVDTSKGGIEASSSIAVDVDGSLRVNRVEAGRVSFTHVDIRFYHRMLEINPAVTSGPAIGIGWNFRRGGQIHIDDWEIQRGGPTATWP